MEISQQMVPCAMFCRAVSLVALLVALAGTDKIPEVALADGYLPPPREYLPPTREYLPPPPPGRAGGLTPPSSGAAGVSLPEVELGVVISQPSPASLSSVGEVGSPPKATAPDAEQSG